MASKQKKAQKAKKVPAPNVPDVAAEPKIRSPTVQKALDVNLLHAAKKGEWGRMKKLLESGAEPLETDDFGYSALTYAAAEGQHELVQMMVDAGVEVSIEDFASRSAFVKAMAGGHKETADILVKAGKLGEGESIVPPPCRINRETQYVFLDFVAQMAEDEDW